MRCIKTSNDIMPLNAKYLSFAVYLFAVVTIASLLSPIFSTADYFLWRSETFRLGALSACDQKNAVTSCVSAAPWKLPPDGINVSKGLAATPLLAVGSVAVGMVCFMAVSATAIHAVVSHWKTGRGQDRDALAERRRVSLGIVPAGVAVTLAIAWTPILPAIIASAEEEVQVGWIAYVALLAIPGGMAWFSCAYLRCKAEEQVDHGRPDMAGLKGDLHYQS